ncbi:MAG: hypothetical protein RL274_2080 [Pseudomonadota bacterium]|jgi:hypothetical protein
MTSKNLRAALTAAFLLGAASGAAHAQKPAAPPKLTVAVQKALVEAQTANKKSDFPTAMAAIAKARAVTSRTPYDDLQINRYAMSLNVQQKDLTAAAVAGEAAADTDPAVIPDAEKGPVYTAGLQLALNAKHYDKAARYAKLVQSTTPPPDESIMAMAAQAMYLGSDYAGAMELAQKNIAAAKSAGKLPQRTDFEITMSAQVQQKNQAAAEQTLEQMVATYNDPKDWAQFLGVSLGVKGMRDIDYIYLGRLMFATKAPMQPNDMQLVGATANKQGFYGDAEQAQKQGGPAPDSRMGADRKSIPQQIAAGEKKEGGEYNVKLAQALYAYGMFAEAETAARLAKTKGGAKDPTEADMVIGMSQLAQGKNSEAVATFAGITAPNPASARVLRLWGYHAKAKASPATAAAQ